MELQILGQFEFECQNSECEEAIKYKDYFDHLRKHCKEQTYKNIKFGEPFAPRRGCAKPTQNDILNGEWMPKWFAEEGEGEEAVPGNDAYFVEHRHY